MVNAGENLHRSAGNVWMTSCPARSMIFTLGSRKVSPRSGVVHANLRSTTNRVSFSYGPAVVPSRASMAQSLTIRWMLFDVHESVLKSHVKDRGEVRMFEASWISTVVKSEAPFGSLMSTRNVYACSGCNQGCAPPVHDMAFEVRVGGPSGPI